MESAEHRIPKTGFNNVSVTTAESQPRKSRVRQQMRRRAKDADRHCHWMHSIRALIGCCMRFAVRVSILCARAVGREFRKSGRQTHRFHSHEHSASNAISLPKRLDAQSRRPAKDAARHYRWRVSTGTHGGPFMMCAVHVSIHCATAARRESPRYGHQGPKQRIRSLFATGVRKT